MSSDVLHVHEQLRARPGAVRPSDKLNEIYERLEAEAREQLGREGFSAEAEVDLTRFADMKFSLQIHQVEVPVPSGHADLRGRRGADRPLRRALRADLRPGLGICRGGHSDRASSACSRRGRLRTPSLPAIEEREAPTPESREVYWRDLGGFHATDVFPGHALGAGFSFAGPCHPGASGRPRSSSRPGRRRTRRPARQHRGRRRRSTQPVHGRGHRHGGPELEPRRATMATIDTTEISWDGKALPLHTAGRADHP